MLTVKKVTNEKKMTEQEMEHDILKDMFHAMASALDDAVFAKRAAVVLGKADERALDEAFVDLLTGLEAAYADFDEDMVVAKMMDDIFHIQEGRC